MVFDPITASIAAGAIAASGGIKAYGEGQASKRAAKQAKKQTRSDVLMELLKQHLESQKATRNSSNERGLSHARSLQNKASEFRGALLGR